MVTIAQNRRGLTDWLIQRLSAVILGLYTACLFGFALVTPTLDYQTWYGFMMSVPMKVFNLLAFLALAGHAWVGLWTVTTDYIKPWVIRIAVQAGIMVANLVFLIWAMVIFLGF